MVMNRSLSWIPWAVLVTLLAADTAHAAGPIRVPARAVSPPAGAKTAAEYGRLSPDAEIDVSGRKMKKREFQAEVDRVRSLARGSRQGPRLETVKRDFKKAAQAKVLADNSRLAQMKASALSGLNATLLNAALPPRITSVLMVPPLTPGEDVFIKGTNLGPLNYQSHVRLKGNFPAGALTLKIIEWKNDFVHAQLPFVSGVADHAVKLLVVRDGKPSNEWNAAFEAERTVDTIRREDYVIVRCHPVIPRDGDFCNPSFEQYVGFSAIHRYSSFDLGYDVVRVQVSNGWSLLNLNLSSNSNGSESQVFAAATGLVEGATTGTLRVDWLYMGMGGLGYRLDTLIAGPMGIDYK